MEDCIGYSGVSARPNFFDKCPRCLEVGCSIMKTVAITTLGILLLHGCSAICFAQRARERSKPTPLPKSFEKTFTPLMRAAGAGRISAVRYLLDKGAGVNEKDPIGL